MAESNRRKGLRTLLVVAVIVALACTFVWRQRRVERLRSALAVYKRLSHKRVVARLNNGAHKLDWSDDTPLSEVITRIKVYTKTSMPIFSLGVPVAVDPVGLETAGRSLSSAVQRPPADPELSLRQKLQTVLKPLGLACQIKDATIVITSERMVDEPAEDEDDGEQ